MESAVASVLPDPKSDSILPKFVRKSTAFTYVCPPEADQHPACQQMGLKLKEYHICILRVDEGNSTEFHTRPRRESSSSTTLLCAGAAPRSSYIAG